MLVTFYCLTILYKYLFRQMYYKQATIDVSDNSIANFTFRETNYVFLENHYSISNNIMNSKSAQNVDSRYLLYVLCDRRTVYFRSRSPLFGFE